MIQNYHGYKYTCEECKNIIYQQNHTNVRKLGWAVAKDYKKCYCPNCAKKRRNVGRKGFQEDKQLKIST